MRKEQLLEQELDKEQELIFNINYVFDYIEVELPEQNLVIKINKDEYECLSILKNKTFRFYNYLNNNKYKSPLLLTLENILNFCNHKLSKSNNISHILSSNI
jgi:hypothetical protein